MYLKIIQKVGKLIGSLVDKFYPGYKHQCQVIKEYNSCDRRTLHKGRNPNTFFKYEEKCYNYVLKNDPDSWKINWFPIKL